ncbi:hypothetical protein NQM64_001545 [Escherichia coli]|nr:hypothetical protein [Escherichia coli]
MEALVVERSEDGYWTHPEYANLFGDREAISADEFRSFCKQHGIESSIVEMENDNNQTVIDAYFEDGNQNISGWEPSMPDGEGWFVGSIHDTEDGPICVWFRNVDKAA